MSKKSIAQEEALLSDMLERMREQGLPVQTGGFEVEAIPSGITSFDLSTGVVGIPRRRISLFVGNEGSGKTLLLLTLVAAIQRDGGRAAIVDAEHALTPGFARLLGVDYDSLTISRPKTLEQCYDVFKEFISSGLFDVVGFDSAVALPCEGDLHLSASESTKRAGQAQIHSTELKKVVSLCHDRTAMVIINQIRINPNPPSYWSGPPMEYSPGGVALNFYASLRVKFKTTKTFKTSGGQRIGHRIRTTITKNKVAPPFMTAEFDIKYTDGLDSITDLIETAISLGVIYKKSSWFYFDLLGNDGEVIEEHKWLGRDKLDAAIRDDETLEIAVRDRLLVDDEDDEDDEPSGWDNI